MSKTVSRAFGGFTSSNQKAAVHKAAEFDSIDNLIKNSGDEYGIVNKSHIVGNSDVKYNYAYGGSVDFFSHPIFDTPKSEEAEYYKHMGMTENVLSGIIECDKCGHNKVFAGTKQVRSGDESMTTFYRCTKCNYSWSES